MPLESYSDPPDDFGFVQNWRTVSSRNSERINGKLVLRNNDFVLLAGALGSRRFQRGYQSWCWPKAHSGSDVPMAAHQLFGIKGLQDVCYGKLRGKLYEGKASLGVTLATVKQSREMIATRYAFLTQRAESAAADLLSWEKRGRRTGPKYLERLAGFHLEVIFGWTPVLQDIHAAATSVIQLADQHERISVGANNNGAVYRSGFDTWVLQARVAYSTQVRIKNPNTWLAERAGLLNPAVVAWDLVPWSFVVNMFVNTGALVQSITDFQGLQFGDTAATTTWKYRAERNARPYAHCFMSGIHIDRRLAPIPSAPGLKFSLPEARWETAAMAASLFTQRFRVVSKFVGPRWTAARSRYKEAWRNNGHTYTE